MSARRSHRTVEPAILVIALAFPFARFFLDLNRGVEYLLYQYLGDDAFYYFEISRHIPEFNIGIPNSGFHPLYALIISPIQVRFQYAAAIPASLFILVSLIALSGLIAFRLLTAFWPRWVALISALLWFTSPQLYSIAMSGLETMLATALILLFLLALRPALLPVPGRIGTQTAIALGLLAGLSFLGRMDSPLILIPSLFLAALRLLREGKPIELSVLTISAVVLPAAWLSYVYSVTGDVFPTSAAALRVLRGIDDSAIVSPGMMISSVRQLANSMVDFFVIVPRPLELGLLAIIIPAGTVAIAASLLRPKNPEQSGAARLAVALLLGTGLWAIYYIAHQGGFRRWYFAQIAPAVFLVFVPALLSEMHLAFSRIRWPLPCSTIVRRHWLLPALALVVLGAAAMVSSRYSRPFAAQEYDKYRSALVANSFFPADSGEARIGAFNAGIYNYFMEADVINLDGVVNPGAMRALQENRLPDYLVAMNIRYLIEHDFGEASNLFRLQQDDRVKIEKWIDLTQLYESWNGQYAKHTFLWTVTISDDAVHAEPVTQTVCPGC